MATRNMSKHNHRRPIQRVNTPLFAKGSISFFYQGASIGSLAGSLLQIF